MTVHDETKFVEIWLTKDEAKEAVLREKLIPVCKGFKKKKYLVAVYESGSRDLTDGMEALLKINREKIAKERTRCAMMT